ncbi:hypothetical protein [Synechococcus sp. HK01-R]|uniref:hypothetical protein n=1 Tax=Synechococcus sp. HK01-R TaxID=2751171 RepID=UPI00351B85FA
MASLLIPVILWAAITPHLHSDLSMRILHAVSVLVLVLLPLLRSLWLDRRQTLPALSVVLAVFLLVMATVNSWIAFIGMGVDFGWIDHLFLALGALSVEAYYFLEPKASNPLQRRRSPHAA